jgi:hypothetical protein
MIKYDMATGRKFTAVRRDRDHSKNVARIAVAV